jgi:hypothetical protein
MDGLFSFTMDDQAGGCLADGGDVDAGDTEEGIGAVAPRPARAGSRVVRQGFFEKWLLVATNSKRPLCVSFLPRRCRPKAQKSAGPNHA